MAFSSDRRKAAALVTLVFVLGIALGVAGVLGGRRVLGGGDRGGDGNRNGQDGRQTSQLVRELNLTPDQERQFRQVLSDTRDRYESIRRAMNSQFSQVRQQNRDRIREILTAEQKPLFDDFLGQSRNRRNDNNNNRRNDQNNRGNQNTNQGGNRNGQTSQVARLTQQLHSDSRAAPGTGCFLSAA
jgi:Spy/CpxP family protein refolding chaperone